MRLRPGTDTSCERKLRICDKENHMPRPAPCPKRGSSTQASASNSNISFFSSRPELEAPKSAANAAFRARNTLKKQEAPLFRAEAKIRKVDQALGFPLRLSNQHAIPAPPPPRSCHSSRSRPSGPGSKASKASSKSEYVSTRYLSENPPNAQPEQWQPAQTKRLMLGYGQREGNVAKPGGRHKTATNFRGLVAKPWNNHLPTRMSGWRKAGLTFGTRFPCLSTDNNWMKTDGVRYRRAIILSPSVCLLKRLRSGHGEIGWRKSG